MAGDFSTGLAVGLAIGIPSGLIIGRGFEHTSLKERIKKQLVKAIDDNSFLIISSEERERSVEQLFDLLDNVKI